MDVAPVLRQDRKVERKSGALLRGREVPGTGESFLWRVGNGLDVPAGTRPRSASALEGSWLFGKQSSSPEPESGEQWKPFSEVNLVPGGKKTQGPRKPSAVLSADVCLSVCLSSALHVCVCAGICLWSHSLLF